MTFRLIATTTIRRFAFLLSVGMTISLCGSIVLAEDGWTLTTADFLTRRVDLKGISAAGVRVSSGSEAPADISFDRLLMLQRLDKPDASPAGFVVNLVGRDRAAGTPLGIEGENLIWNSPALGKISLPMKNVTSITRVGATEPANTSSPATEDVVTLANGDSVHGIISGIDQTTITIQQPTGEKVPASLDALAKITFASTSPNAGVAKASQRGFRISLASTTALTASKIDLRPDNTLAVTLSAEPETPRVVPLAMVTAIEQVNGPVVWLSSLAPAEAVQTPFLDVSWPARMDRTVDGAAMRFGDRLFTRGIGVHSYSRLAYDIDPSWKTFRTQYAIAGDWTYANVDVRIKVDGKVAHEREGFRSGILSQPIVLDIEGHKKIELEVDYGQNYDVQDRFNWIEPAFLNFKPEPATNSASMGK